MNLKLPEIEPQGPVVSAAEAIDRAGAKFKGAADAVSDVFAAADMAQTATQLQEGTLKTTKGLNDTLDVIKSNPYVKPDQVRALFGGKVPENIALTEKVTTPAGVQERDRAVIPMHEVASTLFDAQAAAAVENAASGIRGAGWQRKFREEAAKDVEAARAHALEWQRAQSLADAEIKSVAQFHQAVDARAWNTAEAILNLKGPNGEHLTMSVPTREKLAAEYPTMRTQAQVADAIGAAGTPEELDKVIADVQANKAGDPEKGQFAAPLSIEDQNKFTAVARARKHELIAEQDAAAKRAYEGVLQEVGGYVEAAITKSRETGLPATAYFGASDLGKYASRLKTDDWHKLLGYLEARSDVARQTNPAVWTELMDKDRLGTLQKLTPVEIYGYAKDLSEPDYKDITRRWAASRGEGGASKPLFNDEESRAINDVLTGPLKLAPPTDSPKARTEYLVRRAMLERGLLEWKRNHPDEPALGDAVFTVAAGLWPKGVEIDKDGASGRAVLQVSLSPLLGHFPNKPELDEAARAIDEQKRLVDEAYAAAVNPDEVELNTGLRARIYVMTQNEKSRADLTARILARNPQAKINDAALVKEAMSAIFPDTGATRAYRDAREAKATQAARARDATEAADASRAEDERDTAAMKAEAAARSKAERDRWNALPYWQQQAEVATKKAIDNVEAEYERQVRERVYAEEKANRPKGAYFNEALRPVMEARIKAEVAAGREERRVQVESQMADAKDQYRAFAERVEAKDPAAVQAYQQGAYSFPNWLRMKREGKVQ